MSSTMQQPTATSKEAKRRLKMQLDTKSGRSIDSGGGDGVEHATEGEQHDAAAQRDEPRSGEATEKAARHAQRLPSRQQQQLWRGAGH